ncbi:MAG: hypothetical protein GY866_25055 [Proteobacteria bacterium]|nr:hypothetical protein [Pseudomonadota bacterium]
MSNPGNTPGYDNSLGDITFYTRAYQKQASYGHNEKASDILLDFLGVSGADILENLVVTWPMPRFGREPMAVPTDLGEVDMPGKYTAAGNEGACSFLDIIADSDVEKKLYEFFENNDKLKIRAYRRGEMNQKTKKGWTYYDVWFEFDTGEKSRAEGTVYRLEGTLHWAYALPNDKAT